MTLAAQLVRWAAARDRRNPTGHGKTGTELLRDAASRVTELEGALRDADEHLRMAQDIAGPRPIRSNLVNCRRRIRALVSGQEAARR